MKKMSYAIGAICLLSGSLPALAQQNKFQHDAGSQFAIAIPAFSLGKAENLVVEEPDIGVKLKRIDGVYVKTVDGEEMPLSSCAEYIQEGLGKRLSGVYKSTHAGGLNLYCDMTTAGGGWTLVVAQYENSPVRWETGGRAYDPSLTSLKGWAMENLPSHTQVGFGQKGISGLYPSYYMNFTYTTEDIPKTTITDQNGVDYHIHRKKDAYYSRHDPEHEWRLEPKSGWRNTLTVDYVNETESDSLWTFAPHHKTRNYRGFGYLQNLATSHQAEPWLVFVR